MKTTSVYSYLWLAVAGIGLILMIFMIITESEPGALPLLLIIIGILGYLFRRFRRG